MRELFEKYAIDIEKELLSKFESFLNLFIEKNKVLNLSAIREEKEIIEKHFIDSLILTKFIKLNGKVADIGTGGGFPGIPLAIYCDKNIDFSLIDSIGKKLNAIKEFSEELGLKNITTIHSRFEDLGHDKNNREKYDYVVSRATAHFPVLLEYAIPLLKVGGTFIAYKLDNEEELKISKKALIELGAEISKIEKYELGGTNRTLVFVKKLTHTSKNFPRKPGVPLRIPLI